LIRYGSVGVINTLVGAGVMAFFAYLGFHYSIYTAAGYVVAFIVSYILNGKFTFKADKLSHRGFLLFAAINGILLLCVEVLQAVLIERMNFPEILGVITGMVFYMLTGFVLNRKIVYRTA